MQKDYLNIYKKNQHPRKNMAGKQNVDKAEPP